MRKILPNNKRTKAKLDALPKIYVICKWAKWGILEMPFSGKWKTLSRPDPYPVPLVYRYHDFNGMRDEYILTPVYCVTTGQIFDWTFTKSAADAMCDMLNLLDSIKQSVRYDTTNDITN